MTTFVVFALSVLNNILPVFFRNPPPLLSPIEFWADGAQLARRLHEKSL
jgi:hypothetical protein